MNEKSMNGWSIEEDNNGVRFSQYNTWEDVQSKKDFNDYKICGMFEDNGSLFVVLESAEKLNRLLKVTQFADGRFYFQTMRITKEDFHNIIITFCDPNAAECIKARQAGIRIEL